MKRRPSDLCEFVDPDPFVVAGVWLMSATVVLQLVQIWQASRGTRPQEDRAQLPIMNQALSQLEQQLGDLNGFLRSLTREVEQSSPNADAEYFDAPFRIGTTQLNVPGGPVPPLQSLGPAYARLGNVATWINQIIVLHPALAHRLGGRMSAEMKDVADTLNRAMAQGSPNRIVQAEGRRALVTLAAAIEAELGGGLN